MDIIVKSFYRPYYLERCLRSIELNIVGDYKVTILDDGTPQVYIDRIMEQFPLVTFIKSDEYDNKTSAISQHLDGLQDYKNDIIPVQLWKEGISKCNDYFLLLEEDAWITHSISIEQILKLMQSQNILIIKLGWNGNPALINGSTNQLTEDIDELLPKLPNVGMSILNLYFKNAFRIRSILNKLRLVTIKSMLPFYQLYTVSSAFFNKDYWIYIWEESKATIDEPAQLLRAIKWKKEVVKGKYANTKSEYIKTSFLTASVNRFKINQFDMIRLNHILNESWLEGNLEAMNNFPHDFDLGYLQQIVDKTNDPHCTVADWNLWIDLFKGIHSKAGSKVD